MSIYTFFDLNCSEETESNNKNEWEAMIISTYATHWGKLQIQNTSLVFATTSQPDDMSSSFLILF